MKKIIVSSCAILIFILHASAQVVSGKKNIERLCGCFEVEFKYAETFSPDKNYIYHEREEISAGLELALPIEVSDKKISIQHLLIIDDNYIVKHWREDWVFEPTSVWKYEGDKRWDKEAIAPESSKGKWLQSVWEVSDAPRYQGAGDWITTDGKIFWQNTTDAPLPRREYTTRNDYNILRRTNRIVLTDSGWVHEQDNQKIIRQEGKDKLLVEEKGLNTYKRVAEKACGAAKTYWLKNQEYWSNVRTVWDEYINMHSSIRLHDKVEGKMLHENLTKLAGAYSDKKIKSSELNIAIKAILIKYLDKGNGSANGD